MRGCHACADRRAFGFLNQAVRAGNEQAMIDYRVESPNGGDITTFDPRDPLLTAWKKDSNAYLQQLAADPLSINFIDDLAKQ